MTDLRVAQLVYDKITDEMLTTPVGELTEAESAMIEAVLRGPLSEDLMVRIRELRPKGWNQS